MGNLLQHKLALAPRSPGVYLFKDATGAVVYVGKAASLRNRVASYFGSKSGLSTKVLRLVSVVADIEYVLAGSEQEALVLEADLIKRFRPHFNARLKDDKSFPFLRIDVSNDWPGISVVRRRENDGGVYFGPYASARSMRQTLQLIRKAFRFRACRGPLPQNRTRGCLNMDIGLCPGPCVGAIARDDYRRTIDRIILFLQGKHREVLASLASEMKAAAARMEFERAASLRDRIRAVELVTERYAAVTALRGDQDIIALAQDEDKTLVDVFSVRDGRALGRQGFPIANSKDTHPGEILRTFLLQYYPSASTIPPIVMVQHPIADARLIAGWLTELRGEAVHIVAPRSGVRKELMDHVADGVARQLASQRALSLHDATRTEAGLKQLKDTLGLTAVPRRIEGYDISTTQGRGAVGSMVVFVDGVPTPSEYRRFRIKTVEGQDDYAMLREVLLRRLAHVRGAQAESPDRRARWDEMPSLIMVDGGRGQLGAALSARHDSAAGHLPVISLAKEREEVFVEGRAIPADLAADSPGLLLLQAVRDEAHRYAVAYHRKVRSAAGMASRLDAVTGIGPRRKRRVLLAFDSLDALRAASPADIASHSGIPLHLATTLKAELADGEG
jgi:excinuclease ABC subunit C